jgi:hypothetical protein
MTRVANNRATRAMSPPGPHCLYLYLFLDVFSRKIVAWQTDAEENGNSAGEPPGMLKCLCLSGAHSPNPLES